MSEAPLAEGLIRRGRPFSALRRLREEALAGGPRRAHRLRRLARDLTLELEPDVGRAWFPFQAAASGQDSGGLCRITVHRGRPPPLGLAVTHALEVGARLAGRPAAHMHATLWPPDLEAGLGGRSLELAVAVAAWSRLVGVAVPAGFALTGQIEEHGLSAPPTASCAAKARVVSSELGRSGRLVIGGTDGATLETILRDVLRLDVGRPRPLMERVDDARRAHARGDYHRTARIAQVVLARGGGALDADTLVDLGRLRLVALTHEGDIDGALAAWRAVEPRLNQVSPARRARVVAASAIALLDAGRAAEASEVLDATIARLVEATWQDASTRYALCQLCGTRARVASAAGAHRDALRFGERALAHTRPYERARNLGDLALWSLRAGDARGALARLDLADRALDAARAVDAHAARTTEGFLRLFRARALLVEDDAAAAAAAVAGLQPRGNLALALGLLEVHAQLGRDVAPDAVPLDSSGILAPGAPVSAASRLRARIELRRAAPDLVAVARWTGVDRPSPGRLLAELDATVPY